MGTKTRTVMLPALWLAIGLITVSLGCSGASDTPAPQTPTAQSPESTPAQPATDPDSEAAMPPTIPPAEEDAATEEQVATTEADPFAVPEGTPEDIFEFLQRLQAVRPSGQDQASRQQYARNLGTALVTAGDRILAGKPTPEQAEQAVRIKLQGFMILNQSGDESANAKLDAMPAELEAAGFGSLVRVAESAKLQMRFSTLGRGQKDEMAAFAEDVAKFFEKSPPQAADASLAMSVCNAMEQVFSPEKAAEFYGRYGKAFVASDDEQAVEAGAMMAGAARRTNLVGNEMALEGVTLDGEEFQWDTYRGKVVLVDFWATWCPPCLEEMVNIRENYDKYHEHGFDVVGISVDENRDALVSFLKENELPWTILVDKDLKTDEMKQAGKEPMGTRYGIFGIPDVTLVGKDGKVIARNTRGSELGTQLANLLGPIEATEPPTEPAETEEAMPAPAEAAQPDAAPAETEPAATEEAMPDADEAPQPEPATDSTEPKPDES